MIFDFSLFCPYYRSTKRHYKAAMMIRSCSVSLSLLRIARSHQLFRFFSSRDELDDDLTRPIEAPPRAVGSSSSGQSSAPQSSGGLSIAEAVSATSSSDDVPPPWVTSAAYARQRLAIDEHMK
jgi:hypothetical protein